MTLSEQLELDNREASCFSLSRLERQLKLEQCSLSEVLVKIQDFLLAQQQHRSDELLHQLRKFTTDMPEGRNIYKHVSRLLEKRRHIKERRKKITSLKSYLLPSLVIRSPKHPIEHRQLLFYAKQRLHIEEVT